MAIAGMLVTDISDRDKRVVSDGVLLERWNVLLLR